MSRKTEIVTAVGTVSCAVAIGFFMQSTEVAELRYGARLIPTLSAAPLVGEPVTPHAASTEDTAPLDVEAITLTSAELALPGLKFDPGALIRASLDASVFQTSDAASSVIGIDPAKVPDCRIDASASVQAAAIIAFSMTAPCHAGMPVTVRHADLTFSALVSDDGTLDQGIPALAKTARVDVVFETGETAHATTEVDSLPLYDRVVVQWRGAAGIQIHAREFGAGYGEKGHVWAGERPDLTALANGLGGHLEILGDATIEDAHLAEVYTFPSSMTKMSGAVTLTIETEITAENCERDVQARSLQFVAGRRMSAQDVTLSMPSCTSIGSFLVLNNLLEDLTVAQR